MHSVTRLQRWLRVDSAQKPKIFTQIFTTAEMTNVTYWSEIVFSAGIATLGLVLNSPAVIIGAMLISPLMGPIMATGMALASGDLYLAVKAIGKLLASIVLAVGLAGLIVWLLPFHSTTSEILARINPNLLDLGIALFSGLAGSVAVCRAGGGDGVTTLPGVAIAVALMPPLCAVGFGLGSGADMRIMGGAALLFLTNLVAIVASAFLVFLLIGMNTPEIRTEMEACRQDEPMARRLSHSGLANVLSNAGKLRWRVLMLVVLLASIAVPLRSAMQQLAGEAIARGAIQDVVKTLVPSGALVTQQVEVGKGSNAVQLVTTRDIPADRIRAAERTIEQRSGRQTGITVSTMASQGQLAELMQRISAPQATPKPAPPASLDDLQKGLTARVDPILNHVWPADAPLQSYQIAFGSAGIALLCEYQGEKDLDGISLGLIQNQLRDALGEPALGLTATRSAAPASSKTVKAKVGTKRSGGRKTKDSR